MSIIKQERQRHVSQKAQRRLVRRVERVAERHDATPVIQVVVEPVLASGRAYAVVYDERLIAETARASVMDEAVICTARVGEILTVWLPVFAGLLSFDPSALAPESEAPDDVIAAGERVVAYVNEQGKGGLPPAATEALEALRTANELAEAKWTAARAALVDVQVRGQAVRDASRAFHKGLVWLRRVLGSVLGRSHLDYQSLRYGRTSPEADDVEVEEIADPSTPVTESGAPADGDRESGEFKAPTSLAS